MSEIDEKLNQGEKEYRQKHPELNEVKIKIDGESIKKEVRKSMELEQENKQLKEKLGIEDTEAPSGDKVKQFARQLLEAENELLEEQITEDLKKKQLEREYKEGGKGTLPTSLNHGENSYGNSGQKEYNSHEEMIDDLRAKGDTETLNKLWEKSLRGMKENPNKTMNFEYKDDFKDGKSAIRRKLDRDNEKVRSGH